jgi:hypothetical protein
MSVANGEPADSKRSLWGSLTAKEKALLGFLSGGIGVLSGVAQFLGTYIHNGLVLFGVSLLIVCAIAAVVMAIARYRRIVLFTAAFLAAIVVGGVAGHFIGPRKQGPSQHQDARLAPSSFPIASTPPSKGSEPAVMPPSASFQGLPEDTVVQHCVAVTVIRKYIPAGYFVWLAVQVPLENEQPDPSGIYLVKKLPSDSSGRFSTRPVTVGNSQTMGRPYILALYLLDADHSLAHREGQRVTSYDLAGQRILARVRVVRNLHTDNASGKADKEDPGSKQCLARDAT